MEKFNLSEKRVCKNCGYNRFGTNLKVLVCLECGYPKTKRGTEKFKNLDKLAGDKLCQ